MKFHLDMYDVPEWLYKLLKLFKLCKIYAIPEICEQLLDDFIEEKKYDVAKNYLQDIENRYGSTTHTTKYYARIGRMEVLGK